MKRVMVDAGSEPRAADVLALGVGWLDGPFGDQVQVQPGLFLSEAFYGRAGREPEATFA
jgi:hypothetical protein